MNKILIIFACLAITPLAMAGFRSIHMPPSLLRIPNEFAKYELEEEAENPEAEIVTEREIFERDPIVVNNDSSNEIDVIGVEPSGKYFSITKEEYSIYKLVDGKLQKYKKTIITKNDNGVITTEEHEETD